MKVITEEDAINENNIQDLIPLSYRCLNIGHGSKYIANCLSNEKINFFLAQFSL